MSSQYEGHWPHCKCHLQIHRCRADAHYHVIVGPENFSWPFWSLAAGLLHVEFIRNELLKDCRSAAERRWTMEEAALLEVKIQELPKSAKDMPTGFLYQEEQIAQTWFSFLALRVPFAYFDTQANEAAPLFCDFVDRGDIPPQSTLSAEQRIKLAFTAAKPRSMEAVGIRLDLIV